MATKKKQALPFTRQNAFAAPPEELVIIGLDTEDGPEHPLYDERILEPIEDAFVQNIDYYGVLEEVLVRKDGDRVLVLAGRRRVRAARLVNEGRAKRGEMSMKVRIAEKKGDDNLMRGIIVTENAQRRGDSPMTCAKKAQRMRDNGCSDGEIVVAFGITKQTLMRWLSLLDLAAPVQKAVDAGKLSATAAAKLASLPRTEQLAELPALIESGATIETTERRVAKRNGTAIKPKKPSARLVSALVEDPVFLDGLDKQARGLLRWLTGDQDAMLDVPGLDRVLAQREAKPRTKPKRKAKP